MNTLITFIKKEFTEHARTKKILILLLVFTFVGILNPLTALITPFILEMLADSMENSGIIIDDVNITALDSWVQFFKNIPIALIAFILIESSIFSSEYQKGTLTLVLTKGFERFKVVLSKLIVMIVIWTIGYWLCYLITYGYNMYYWDNSIAQNLLFSAVIWWIFGLFVISVFTMFSVLTNTNSSSLILTGISVFGMYLIGLLPKINRFLPTTLMDGNSLIYGLEEVNYYISSLIISISLSIGMIIFSILSFNKKKL
jgi:ABC-2 type transport system permease protein